jgi:acyl-CoA thioesterase-2
MTTPAEPPTMLERLALDEVAPGTFRTSQTPAGGHVFGGLLIGQALRAAQLTVADDKPAHSLHLSFALAGRGGEAITYEVERTRDGASFATRRVVARQARGVVVVLTADFHGDEPGVEFERPATPGVPGPDGLDRGRYDNPYIESRDVPPLDADPVPFARRAWFRPTAPVPDDPLLHLQALAYLSDHGPTRAAREPHAHLADDARRMSVSLDHSVWFHRPIDVNQWLLSELVPVATGRGRGLSIGTLRTVDGTLVATVAQEVLLRER